jgi:DNA polymerase-3 subunit epsilon
MREIVFDTETTGLEWLKGDRLVELGCVELLNHIPTGRTFHAYINPRRPVPMDAVAVHGHTDAFLADKPCFDAICGEFLDFIGDSVLIAHNAAFDRGFINMELTLCQRLVFEDHRFVDTLVLARRRHPNGPNSLDALCARYGINTSARTRHGALLDAQILAEVYLELLGGRQATFALGSIGRSSGSYGPMHQPIAPRPVSLPARIGEADRAAHAAYVRAMSAEALWARYLGEPGLAGAA